MIGRTGTEGAPQENFITIDTRLLGNTTRIYSDVFFNEKLYDATYMYLKCNYFQIYLYNPEKGFFNAQELIEIRDYNLLRDIAKFHNLPHWDGLYTYWDDNDRTLWRHNKYAKSQTGNPFGDVELWAHYFPFGTVVEYQEKIDTEDITKDFPPKRTFVGLGNQYLYEVSNLQVNPYTLKNGNFEITDWRGNDSAEGFGYIQKLKELLALYLRGYQGQEYTVKDKRGRVHPYLGNLTGKYMWVTEPKTFVKYQYDGLRDEEGEDTLDRFSVKHLKSEKSFMYVEFEQPAMKKLIEAHNDYLGYYYYDSNGTYSSWKDKDGYQKLMDLVKSILGDTYFVWRGDERLWVKRKQVYIPTLQGDDNNDIVSGSTDEETGGSDGNNGSDGAGTFTLKKAGKFLLGAGLLGLFFIPTDDEEENKKTKKKRK